MDLDNQMNLKNNMYMYVFVKLFFDSRDGEIHLLKSFAGGVFVRDTKPNSMVH